MTGDRMLVAGIGNVFFGDDGFGVEVLHRLDDDRLPDGVRAREYGIRGVHLAYDLLEGDYATLLVVDALPGGDPPGTLTLMQAENAAVGRPGVEAHSMTPQAVLATLHAIGGRVGTVLVLGCCPASIAPGMGLSPEVAAAVDVAVEMVFEIAGREAAVRLQTEEKVWTPSNF